MDSQIGVTKVNAKNPETMNSPILDEMLDEQSLELVPETAGSCCYFNNVAYENGSYISSGDGEVFHCRKGIWVRESR